jgi:aldose 1-epimerase
VSTRPIPPSGEQHELVHGDQRAVVVEVGGGLRSYAVAGRELLAGYRADEMCASGRGQLLLPWPNRIEDGQYEFGGRSYQLPLTEVGARTAIHGLVRWSAWRVAERELDRVVLEHVLHPQPGYPFALALAVEYALSDDGLQVRMTATNVGADACPYGCGFHPYLTLGTPAVDSLSLTVPARTVVQSDGRGLPLSAATVDGTPYDFRRARPVGSMVLDNAFTDLDRDPDGRARVRLHDPAGGGELSLWVDASYGYLMVFTGDPLPDVNRRSVAVEPMTCPPNAFRSGEALSQLAPGDSTTGAWGLVASLPR